MKATAHPGVGRTGGGLVVGQVLEGKHDAEHEKAAVEQGGGATQANGPEQEGRSGGDGISGS